MFIASFALLLSAILLFAGFASSLSATAQQTTTTPLLPPPPSSSSSGTTTGQSTSPSSLTSPSLTSPQTLTPQEQEQLTRLQNVIAATNLNLDETEKQIGGIVYTPRWSDPVWIEPDSASVLIAYCLPGEFAESGQEILGGGYELEVLESYEVALPQNFMAWMMVIGNEDRQNRYPAAVGVICASDANNAETRVLSTEEQQQINNVVQQITQVTSIDQVINIINNNNNNATTSPQNGNTTTNNRTGGGDTTPPDLSGPDPRTPYIVQTTSSTAMQPYYVDADDDVDGTATLDENNMLTQDNVGGSITISCNPPSNTNLPLGNHTVQCSATDAAGNRGTLSFIISIISDITTSPTPGGTSSGAGITATANPAIYNGVRCPSPLEFTGTITDNVGNRDVTYRFIWSTGAITPVQTIHFNEPGSQTVSYTSPGIAPPSLEGWVAIEILQPNQLQSNQAEMRIICARSGDITASLVANPAFYSGPCPGGTIKFDAVITDNVGNRDVRYEFRIPIVSPPLSQGVIHFDQPGSQVVSYTHTFGGSGGDSISGSMYIRILEPISVNSNEVKFTVNCIPSTEGAPLTPQTLQAENTTTATDEEDTTTAPPATTDEEEEEEDDTTTDGAGDGGGDGTDGGTPPATTEGGGEGGEGTEPPPATTEGGG